MADNVNQNGKYKPHVLVLGSNFGGLTAARLIREEARETVDITVIDRKPYLLFVPNIPLEVFGNHDPVSKLHMPFYQFLKEDKTNFLQAEVKGIDIESKYVDIVPTERLGSAPEKVYYDYLVIALGTRLDYAAIPGFGEYGHTVSDSYYGNKLRRFLFEGHYKGGPIAVGSARFKMGKRGNPEWLHDMKAACEGPPLEISLGLSSLLEERKWGTSKNITLFTPGEYIAEDAGIPIVKEFLHMAKDQMGMGYINDVGDVKQIYKDGIEFTNGASVEAELKIVLPNWNPHEFMKGLPISDEEGFVVTDLFMRNPEHPEIMAVGDASALAAPKLGGLGDMQARIVARQIAKDMGVLKHPEEDKPFKPVIMCFGDMGNRKAFYIHSDLFFGGKTGIMKMGHMYYAMKMGFKEMYYQTGGKPPGWGIKLTEVMGG